MQTFIQALQAAPDTPATGKPPVGQRCRERLVENMYLESASLRPPTWPYPADLPPARGDNLTPAALAEATRRLDAHGGVRATGLELGTLLNLAGEALNSKTPGAAGSDFFFRVATTPAALTGTIWNVRSLESLSYSFQGAGTTKKAKTDKNAWMRSVYDWMTSPDPAAQPVQPDGEKIGLCVEHGSFWLSDRSPLDLLAARGIRVGKEAAARAVLQELALPGFEDPTFWQQALGLVAVEFPAALLVDGGSAGQAWKPTAVDALNFKGYCFLPGKSADTHGLTWPLQKCLKLHERRDGLPEYVHPHIAVPALVAGERKVHLLGFLDAAAEAKWNSLRSPLILS